MPPTKYIFNHIPKTGGNSFLAICKYNLAPSEISPHFTEDQIRLGSGARFEHYRLIAGHFSILTQAKFSPSRYSITLLREPIRKILSTYTFWRGVPEDNEATRIAKEFSFAGFVRYFRDSPLVVDNCYTHHFAGVASDVPGFSSDAFSLLAAAKRNLAAFNLVGICEELERSARLLCAELQWRIPERFPHENRSGSENALEAIDKETMAILASRNRLDFQLYDYAVRLFYERERSRRDTTVKVANHFVPVAAPSPPDRNARILAVKARWIGSGDKPELEIGVEFRTEAEIAELQLGVAIYDATENPVWGTNTAIERLELKYEKGCESRAVFAVLLGVPEGTYHVTAALAQPRRLGFHEHWIDRAASFEATPENSKPSNVGAPKLVQFRSSVHRRFGAGR